MLTSDDIKTMTSNGEGYNVEFKVRVPQKVRDLAEEVCAFANIAGGYLIIGIDDKNTIQGVEIDNKSRSAIENVISDISPAVRHTMYPVEVGEKSVWVIDVLPGKNKPYVFSGAVYIREGSNTQKLTTAEEMRSFFQQSECIFFDEIPCRKFDMKHDLDTEFVSEFKMLAGYHQDIPNEHLFNNLKLYTEDGYFKNGAVLFFGKRPDDLLDSAFVRCVLFDGVDKRYIEDDKRMYGPLYRQYEQALAWLKKHLKVRYDIEGQGGRPRRELWEIPEAVLKEALVNALAHRDYYDKGARITVELFDDRLVVTNPGGLVSSIPPEKFGTISRSRNPLVFGLMERIRMVEYIGSGVMRMRKAMKDAALPQPDFGLQGMFSISLLKQVGFEAEPEPVVERSGLSDIQNRALALIEANSSITSSELSEALSVSVRKIWRIIKYLNENDHIEREGSKKTGIWVVKNKMAQ
jgi:ATP-dependent DNA helicase RecG